MLVYFGFVLLGCLFFAAGYLAGARDKHEAKNPPAIDRN